MLSISSVSVNRVAPPDWKTASLNEMVADVLVAFTANAIDILVDPCEKIDIVKIDNVKKSNVFFIISEHLHKRNVFFVI